jgi:uncharacterized membrane protein YdfJ with MMPL/SSD domain
MMSWVHVKIAGLHRLAHCPRLVIATWSVVVLVTIPLCLRQSSHLSLGGYSVAGSQSAAASAALRRYFPEVGDSSLAVLLSPQHGATRKDMEAAIGKLARLIKNTQRVTLTHKAAENARFAAGLMEPEVVPLQTHLDSGDEKSVVDALGRSLDSEEKARVSMTLLGGNALEAAVAKASEQGVIRAEVIGIPILLLVLYAVFGGVFVATLPLALGAVAVVVAGACIFLLSTFVELSVFTTSITSMVGVGVAVDYSLILLTRVREELQSGLPVAEAIAAAMGTAGKTIVFAGITVTTSLATVWVIPVVTLRSMAAGAMIVVVISVVASLTLLPSLMLMMGSDRLTRDTASRRQKLARVNWGGWVAAVISRRWLAIGGAGLIIFALSLPALAMRTGTGALEQLPPSNSAHRAYLEASRQVGSGTLAPIVVTIVAARHTPAGASAEIAEQLRRTAEHKQDVREVGELSHSGSVSTFAITTDRPPESVHTQRLVEALRVDASKVTHTVTIDVGGAAAILLDEDHAVSVGIRRIMVLLVIAAFAVLTIIFQSVVVSLKAVAMNLCTVAATYGVLVVVFQWGLLDDLLGYRSPGHIYTLVPPLVIAIVFGLSMDYEVLLLSRIRERWLAHGESRRAIIEGVAASARVISSAALVLVCVFAVFISVGVPTVKELGLGGAIAIAMDTTVIRLMLVPALMDVLGAANWWLPPMLSRLFRRSSPQPSKTSSNVLSEAELPVESGGGGSGTVTAVASLDERQRSGERATLAGE